MIKVYFTALMQSRITPCSLSSPKDSASVMRLRREMRLRVARNSSVAAVIKPSPPSWMSTRMTICPNSVKCVPVSTTTRPVTQEADVAVNSASKKLSGSPWEAMGNISSSAPRRATHKKPSGRIRMGLMPL